MAKKETVVADEEEIAAIKGFDRDWKCKGFQFEPGWGFTAGNLIATSR